MNFDRNNKEFRNVLLNDPLVNMCFHAGRTLEETIVVLVEHKNRLEKELEKEMRTKFYFKGIAL